MESEVRARRPSTAVAGCVEKDLVVGGSLPRGQECHLCQLTLAAYGGRFLLGGGSEAETLERRWWPGRLVIFMFASAEWAKA